MTHFTAHQFFWMVSGDRWFADSPLEGTGFEPSVPLLRKALLGVANRRRRHERRSHLQVQVRNGNACLEWLPIAFPFAEGREFESVFLQRRVSGELRSEL